MATLEQRNGWFRIVYRYQGKKRSGSLNTQDQKKADFQLAKLELLLRRIKLGEASIPDESDPLDHLLKKTARKEQKENMRGKAAKPPKKKKLKLTIRDAWQRFKEALPFDSLEESTLKGMSTHVDHLVRLIGKTKALDECAKPVIQKYIDSRSKEPGRRGHNVSVQTIKKELRTLSTIWNWAIDEQLLKSPFLGRKLRYPKYTDKPPFQTISQIRGKIKRFSLTENQQAELWESVFLSVTEVNQVLDYVKNNLRH